MSRYFFAFFLLLLISCNRYTPREIDQVEIATMTIDSVSIRAIQVIDDSTLYYAGSNGVVASIKSGKEQWKEVFRKDSITPHFRSIAFNGKAIFLLSIANPALLYKIDIDSKTPELVYTEEHKAVFYDSMKFFDEKNGMAMGDPTENCLSILTTNYGGDTWKKTPCNLLPTVEDGEAAFAASNTNIKVLGTTAWVVTGGTKARVFKTSDMGKNWEVYETPIIQGDGPQGIYSVDFADLDHGIIIGGDYSKPKENKANAAITKDGGKTWQLVADGLYPNYKSCVQYVPNTQGKEVFAVGKTGIAYSNDGGLSWKHVSDDPFYVIQFANSNSAWLAGHEKIGSLKLGGE